MIPDSPFVSQIDPSPNFGIRRDKAKVTYLLLHYTGMETAEAAQERLKDPVYQVSAHYLIHEDGTIIQMVAEENRAHHAGLGAWKDITDLNSHSIGIELVNKGHEFGYHSFSERQMHALEQLCLDILKRHPIPAAHILGHSDIAPLRKEDPGEKFDWSRLAAHKIGLYPDSTTQKTNESPLSESDLALFEQKLHSYGYRWDKKSEKNKIFIAFQRHFHPENLGNFPSMGDLERINSLIKMSS